MFLYAPLVAATWSAHAMACCTGDHCPIQQHHHHRNALPTQHEGMECEHGMAEMMNCSMACCENSDKPVITAVTFVLPHLTAAPALSSIISPAETARAVAIPRCAEPVSPPPRLAQAS